MRWVGDNCPGMEYAGKAKMMVRDAKLDARQDTEVALLTCKHVYAEEGHVGPDP